MKKLLSLCSVVVVLLASDVGAQRVAIESSTVLTTYDVSDLTGDRKLTQLAELATGSAAQDRRLQALDEYVAGLKDGDVTGSMESIVAAVRELIQPPLEPGEQRVEGIREKYLVVHATDEQQAWVRSFLEATRAFEGYMLVQAKVLTLPPGHLEEIVGQRSGHILDAVGVERMMTQVARLRDSEIISAPRLMTLPYQSANLRVMNQTAYIKDYEVVVLPGKDTELADPVIDVLETGLSLDMRGVPLGAERLALRCKLAYTTARTPIPQSKVRVGAAGHEFTIQLPETRTVRVQGRFDLEPGASAVMATTDPGFEGAGEPRDIVVVLTASRISLAEAGIEAGAASER